MPPAASGMRAVHTAFASGICHSVTRPFPTVTARARSSAAAYTIELRNGSGFTPACGRQPPIGRPSVVTRSKRSALPLASGAPMVKTASEVAVSPNSSRFAGRSNAVTAAPVRAS